MDGLELENNEVLMIYKTNNGILKGMKATFGENGGGLKFKVDGNDLSVEWIRLEDEDPVEDS